MPLLFEGNEMPECKQYDPESTARYFDDYGEREWQRLVSNPVNEISLFLHTHYLSKYVHAGMRVLEIGAGAGRFTQVLAGLGARVVVGDISAGQLELNRGHALELGFAAAVEDWAQVDICELGRYSAGQFDAVVAYGGPFSYALDRRDDALRECRRVLKPGGVLLLSVMCLWGTVRRSLREVLVNTPVQANQRIIATGDISPATYPDRPNSYMHLFRGQELKTWLREGGLEVLDLSASGCLAAGWESVLEPLRADPLLWGELLRMDLEASCQPGCLEMGTHMIAVTRKA